MADHVVRPNHSADYFDPANEPEPSAETGLGTHFNNTFDPSLKKDAPTLPVPFATATGEAASERLASTSSTMTTAQLQRAAIEGDPNGLTNGLMPPNGKTEKAPPLETKEMWCSIGNLRSSDKHERMIRMESFWCMHA